MCNFCSDINIITSEKYYSLSSVEKNNLPIIFIMKDDIVNQYHLSLDCEGFLYSGPYLNDIKYCPKCGRKLDER